MMSTENPKKRFLFFVPILVGGGILILLVLTRSGPERVELREEVRTVRVIEVPSVDVVPRAVGYGPVAPVRSWEGVAEVSGRIVEKHPQLEKGGLVPEGALLLSIDSTDYELALRQAETNIEATEARLAELEARRKNIHASLEIEEEALQLGEKELKRQRSLVKQGNLSRSRFEQQERSVLQQKQSVQAQKNSLSLIPAEKRSLRAELRRYRAQWEGACRDLERTMILAPFTGRVAEVKAELMQYARQGAVLVILDDTEVAEVTAQVPVNRMRSIVRTAETFGELGSDMATIRRAFGLRAKVRFRVQDAVIEWAARFSRMSDTIDPATRTVGVIVEVEGPYERAKPGERPPLVKGMFVEVELLGKPLPARLVVPRTALRDGVAYLVDGENRLRLRRVEIGLVQPGFVTVKSGLSAGDELVVSDLFPAVEGMALDPVSDELMLKRLVADAQAEGAD